MPWRLVDATPGHATSAAATAVWMLLEMASVVCARLGLEEQGAV